MSSSVVNNLISIFKKVNVVKFGSFELKDGSLSKVYIDLRILPNFPKEFKETVKIMARVIGSETEIEPFDGIIAPPMAGIPLGVALALEMNKEFYLARSKPKKHGTMKLIEGDVSNKRLLVVDDVFTTGQSKVPLLNAIRDHGGIVKTLCVVVNRTPQQEQLIEFEQKNQLRVHHLLLLKDLI